MCVINSVYYYLVQRDALKEGFPSTVVKMFNIFQIPSCCNKAAMVSHDAVCASTWYIG